MCNLLRSWDKLLYKNCHNYYYVRFSFDHTYIMPVKYNVMKLQKLHTFLSVEWSTIVMYFLNFRTHLCQHHTSVTNIPSSLRNVCNTNIPSAYELFVDKIFTVNISFILFHHNQHESWKKKNSGKHQSTKLSWIF